MLRLLIDHDLDQDILRGLIRRVPELDAVTAYDIGKSEVRPRATCMGCGSGTRARNSRPPDHAGPRRSAPGSRPGLAAVIVVARRIPISTAIDVLEMPFYAVNLRNG